jgi:hypothetical protein
VAKRSTTETPLGKMIGEIITEATTGKRQFTRILAQAKRALKFARTIAPAARRSTKRLARRKTGLVGATEMRRRA